MVRGGGGGKRLADLRSRAVGDKANLEESIAQLLAGFSLLRCSLVQPCFVHQQQKRTVSSETDTQDFFPTHDIKNAIVIVHKNVDGSRNKCSKLNFYLLIADSLEGLGHKP